MLKPIVILLLGAPLTAAAASPSALSLEATFDAHALAIFQDDARAKDRLRTSLMTAATPVPADIELRVESRVFQNLAERHGKAIADALQTRWKTLRCRATGSDVETSGSFEFGAVTYQCVLPDMSGHFDGYRNSRLQMKEGKGNPMDDDSFRTAYAAALRNAPVGLHEGRMRFIRDDGGPWDSIEMLHFDDHIRRLLMPMQAWDERIDGEGLPADLSPQDEYTLQARVLLHDDAGARQMLRDRGNGYEPAVALEWQLIVDDVPATLSGQGSAAPSPAATRAFVQALTLRLPRVSCAARGFVPLQSPEIGRYQLVCQHPDVEPFRQEYLALRTEPEAGRQERIDALFLRWAAVLRDAPDVPHCSAVTGPRQARDEFTHAERVYQLHRSILSRLLPIPLWFGEPALPQEEELSDDD